MFHKKRCACGNIPGTFTTLVCAVSILDSSKMVPLLCTTHHLLIAIQHRCTATMCGQTVRAPFAWISTARWRHVTYSVLFDLATPWPCAPYAFWVKSLGVFLPERCGSILSARKRNVCSIPCNCIDTATRHRTNKTLPNS